MRQDLTSGQNVPLPGVEVKIQIGGQPRPLAESGLAVVVFPLDSTGRACQSVTPPLLHRGAPLYPGGGVRYDADGEWITVDTARLPAEVARIAVCCVVTEGAGRGLAINICDHLQVECHCAGASFHYALPCREREEAALVLVEIYRRGEGWKLRAVGQGYVWGLRQLGEGYGLDLPDRLGGGRGDPAGPDGTPGGNELDQYCASGSGYCVHTDGYILTNQHVVADCTQFLAVTTRCRTTLDLVFSDFVNDLALLRSATPLSSAAVFREGQAVAMGEQVMTVGYPLAGLLGTTPSVTVGNVSSLVAVGDDTRGLRFTAPIQKGNSGGPLLDASGLVVGTVASKLAADRLHEMTGDLPENVNFALKGAMVRSFLEATGITYATSPPRADRGAAAVAQDACGFVYRILCR